VVGPQKVTQMCSEPKRAILEDPSCLKASTVPLKVAVAQPLGTLHVAQQLGPHYETDYIAGAKKRVNEFLRIVRETNSELAMAPEFFLPVESAREVFANPAILRADTVYVLPMESVTYAHYLRFVSDIREGARWDLTIAGTEDVQNIDGRWINSALILYMKHNIMKAFIQPKTKPAGPELNRMVCGKEIFGFQGTNGVLAVAMCADVHQPLSDVWRQIAGMGSFSYTVHCQFNSKPDFESYYTGFWSSLLNDEGGNERMIFSLNWCRGALIKGTDEPVEIYTQSNRYIRGTDLQKNYIFREQSLAGLHLQQRPQPQNPKKIWETWYCITNTNSVRIFELVRPRQGVPPAQGDRSRGIVSSLFYEQNNGGEYETKEPKNLAVPFFESLGSIMHEENTSVATFFNGLSLCELEVFCSACNMLRLRSWLKDDIDVRLPTALLLCRDPKQLCEGGQETEACPHRGKSCNLGRSKWETDLTNVAFSIKAFEKFRTLNNLDIRADITGGYPTNLLNTSSRKHGWLLHGRGWVGEKIGKEIRELLKDSLKTHQLKHIDLFVNGAISEIKNEHIFDHPSDDIAEPPTEAEHDTYEEHHLPSLHIYLLTDGVTQNE
jgi:hypothetical protein